MEAAVILAVAASFCTATASVCQRLGARTGEVTGFDPRLILRLVRRPVWLAGIASMMLGFGFQLSALRFGPLALVQPTLALELLFVFGYMTATGICWGFEAAVIKEFSSRVGDGLGAIVSNWSLYVLVGGGALIMLLASHAMAAGPLAASQPGFTILDPLAASFLGVFLFGEDVRTGLPALAGEALALALALALLVAGVSALRHSHLATGEGAAPSPGFRDYPPTGPR